MSSGTNNNVNRIPDSPPPSGRKATVKTKTEPENNDAACNKEDKDKTNQDNSGDDTIKNYLSFADQSKGLRARDEQEQEHWNDVCRAYRQYAIFASKQFALNQPNRLNNVTLSLQQYLPEHLKFNTPEYQDRMKQYKQAAIRNQFCLDCILRHAGLPHSQETVEADNEDNSNTKKFATESQISKVSSVLKSLTRDWSTEGSIERKMAYEPIIQSLRTYVPVDFTSDDANKRKVCVPGAGVGRLACELVSEGYSVQGNEFSLYMLLASDFILNGPIVVGGEGTRPISISPWLLETRNVKAATDPLRTVQIPDVNPYEMVNINSIHDDDNDITSDADFSMAAGDFCSIYAVDSEKETWDAVVACFFLDASPSIIQTIQVIYHMLKPGGYLIHFGPLHWHWSGPAMQLSDVSIQDYHERYNYLDTKYMQSIDFCWDDIQDILCNIGFDIIYIEHNIPALYTADMNSMLRTEYQCTHLVARKK